MLQKYNALHNNADWPLINPYCVMFFSSAIEKRLREVGKIFDKTGCIVEDLNQLAGRELGLPIAKDMITLSKEFGFPPLSTKYRDFPMTIFKNAPMRPKIRSWNQN